MGWPEGWDGEILFATIRQKWGGLHEVTRKLLHLLNSRSLAFIFTVQWHFQRFTRSCTLSGRWWIAFHFGGRPMSPGDSSPQVLPLDQLGRYRLLEKLGQGGMGSVFLAQDTTLDRRVAVKILPPNSVNDPAAVARFQREAKALAKLSHPGIVQAHDCDNALGRHFLVMEHVEGKSLARVLHEQGRIPPTRAADYIHQAAEALQHAHERGLIHRDLKPSNLLLTPRDQVKLLDLGLARFLQDQIGDPDLTREGAGLGTPDYTPPEQFRDAHHADPRSDIYALGCTLYHLITGKVPFPGSSLAEKCRAHESQEPTPVEELCPEIPGGLALVVRRMMAKRPADRFQTAREVADALLPYVAGSSAVFGNLRSTASWRGAQLTMPEFAARFPRRRLLLAGAALATVLSLGLGIGWMLRTHSPTDAPPEHDPLTKTNNTPLKENPGKKTDDKVAQIKKDEKKAVDAKKDKPREPPAVDDPPGVLTVSHEAKDGGRFRTLAKALEEVQPGQTIRVLDEAIYVETVTLNRPGQFAGITLEAVRPATLKQAADARWAVTIVNVPNVTIRGFRIRPDQGEFFPVIITGQCPGLLLEHVDIQPSSKEALPGIIFEKVDLAQEDAPVVVQNCRIAGGGGQGIYVMGLQLTTNTPLPCKRIILRNNTIVGGTQGIALAGSLQQIHVVGNRVAGCGQCGIQLMHLSQDSKDLLIANNTLCENGRALRLWDTAVKGKNIQFRNNLILTGSLEPDLIFLDSGGDAFKAKGAGDGSLVLKDWRMDYNWREVRPPKGGTLYDKAWIPVADRDKRVDYVDGLSRNPAAVDFVQPKKGSPLADAGAGKMDPSLPAYVGAVPPQDAAPWDWSRTWLAPPPGRLLTVSNDPAGDGQYRTLRAAIQAAKPWSTIRVLDDATYSERIVIDDAGLQGLVLEAPKRATLQLTEGSPFCLSVKGVPHVRVQGFRFRSGNPTAGLSFVVARDDVTGLVLEDLDLQAEGLLSVYGIRLTSTTAQRDHPVRIRRCTVQVPLIGIVVFGPKEGVGQQHPTRGLLIHDNQLSSSLKGILLVGRVEDIQVTGNIVWNCNHAGLQVEDLGGQATRLLFANNTVFDSVTGFRVWNNRAGDQPALGQVELQNNLFFDTVQGDLMAFVSNKTGGGTTSVELAREVAQQWRFAHNRRDLSGSDILPLAPGDQLAKNIQFLSRKPRHPDFMRPVKGSAWADQGAGHTEPALPRYIGAVPPQGTSLWEWDRTWRSRRPLLERKDLP